MASSPPTPAPRPLFYSPSPPPKTPEPGPSSPTSPLPRRRLPVSPRTSAKRSPAGPKPWTRRLNLGSPAAPIRAAAPAGLSTGPEQSGPESGVYSCAGKAEGVNDAATDATRADTFNLSALAKELDEIAAAQAAPPAFRSKFFASAHSLKAPVRAPTRVNDLPDEILLRIFGFREFVRDSRPHAPRRQRLSMQHSLSPYSQWMISSGTERFRLAFLACPNGPRRHSESPACANVGSRCVAHVGAIRSVAPPRFLIRKYTLSTTARSLPLL